MPQALRFGTPGSGISDREANQTSPKYHRKACPGMDRDWPGDHHAHRAHGVTCGLAILAFIMEFPYVLIVAGIADATPLGRPRRMHGSLPRTRRRSAGVSHRRRR